jgi:hypothetical protein
VADYSAAIQAEQLLQALGECGDQLDMWISESQANACLFAENPALAMQAAGPDLDLDVMLELEAVLSGLARKLELPLHGQRETTAA